MIINFRKNNLLSVSLKNSIQVIVRVIVGVLNIKAIALFLGPTGLAMISQLQSFLQLTVNIAGIGINNGVIKLISENANKDNSNQQIINSSFTIVIISSVIVSIVVSFCSNNISLYLFNSVNYSSVIAFSGIYILSTSLFNVLLSIINGLQKLRIYISMNIIYFISGFLVFLTGIWLFNLKGALWAILIQSIISLLICFYKLYKIGKIPKVKLNPKVLKSLSKFSLMALISGIISPLVVMSVRKIIMINLSLNDAGIWDGVYRISTSYISLATLPFSYYFLPKLSKLTNPLSLKHEMKSAFYLLIPLLIIGGITMFFCRFFIINLLLSNDFNEAASIIKWQITGDFFKVFCWLLGIYLIAKEKVTTFITTEVLSGGILVALCYYLIPQIGLEGSTLAYLFENIISFTILIIIFFLNIKMGIKSNPQQIKTNDY